jgi:hypothetical protein
MREQPTNYQVEANRRYQAGVAKRLDLILSEIGNLRTAVTAVLAERQQPEKKPANHQERTSTNV